MKKNKIKVEKKEIIITVVVLVGTLVLGIFLGKLLFDAFQAKM